MAKLSDAAQAHLRAYGLSDVRWGADVLREAVNAPDRRQVLDTAGTDLPPCTLKAFEADEGYCGRKFTLVVVEAGGERTREIVGVHLVLKELEHAKDTPSDMLAYLAGSHGAVIRVGSQRAQFLCEETALPLRDAEPFEVEDERSGLVVESRIAELDKKGRIYAQLAFAVDATAVREAVGI